MRALIDTKWPLIRNAIIKKLFIPYLIFLLLFLVYTVYIFEILHAGETPPDPDGLTHDESASNETSTEVITG